MEDEIADYLGHEILDYLGYQNLITFTLEELMSYTDGLNVAEDQSGKCELYRGNISGRDDGFNGMKIAVKVFTLGSNDFRTIQEWEREIRYLMQFDDHPRIIKLIGKCQTNRYLFLIFPWMEKGDLYHNIPGLNWPRAVKILKQTAQALQMLHAEGLVYRDLKPHNILVDEYWNAILCDFGLVGKELEPITGGTPPYAEPAVFEGKARTYHDVYSFGILISLIISKSLSVVNFWDWEISAVHIDLISTGCSESHTERIVSLAKQCIKPERWKRPSIDVIIRELEELQGEESSSNPPSSMSTVHGVEEEEENTGRRKKGFLSCLSCFSTQTHT